MNYKNLFTLFLILLTINLSAQKKRNKALKKAETEIVYNNIEWRNIGPFRGGRSVYSTGVVNNPGVFYMGSTGGGVWKTTDNGITWKNISDGYFNTGTVGAIEVSESDSNIVIVGMGEHAARGVMTSMGDGVYKSEDGGSSWTHIGLDMTSHISNVQIHPNNPNIMYVAAQGSQYGPTEDRGIYRTINGGKTWKKVLYKSDTSGASSLSMDMNNPRILYAALWEHERKPWEIKSGGEESALYKTTDGGDNWKKLEEGLPKLFGKSGISVSRANSEIVYSNIEAPDDQGGVYRSDDGGKKWKQVNKDRITVARSWYYMEVFADPLDENTVYVLNAPVLKSIDRGKTFETVSVPHGDNHHLWINPKNNKIMINSNDGGANISLDGGKSWSSQKNQPTSQFYRVIADNQVPYHIYGGQQDNSAIGIKSKTNGIGIDWKDWYSVAGCESAYLAFNPDNPKIVFGGCYQGIIERWNRESNESKSIKEYPELGLGKIPKDFKYRYNWNAPIISDFENPSIIYHAGNVVFKSNNSGIDWEVISPDLTRNNKDQQGLGGLPFTNEAAGGENYNTIMSLVMSPHSKNILWVGSDDGLIHITQNGGKTWKNVTPKDLEESIINSIEVSPHSPGTAYIVAMRYKFQDLKSYIYKTSDYGSSWNLIIDGIDGKHNFTRVVRADKKIKELLYAGTETGFYISKNDGKKWNHLQLNLPVVPINDLFIRDNDLIAATAGRSFWILDDIAPFQIGEKLDNLTILKPKDTYRILGGRSSKKSHFIGTNPLPGVILDYFIPKVNDSISIKLEILEKDEIIRTYFGKSSKKTKTWPGGPNVLKAIPSKEGLNRFNWDLKRDQLPSIENVFVYGSYNGSTVSPGEYKARISLNNETSETSFKILANPKINALEKTYKFQQEVLKKIEKTIIEIHNSVNKMRSIQKQIKHHIDVLSNYGEFEKIISMAKLIEEKLKNWEKKLIQPNQKTFQDVINFHNKLNADLMHLKNYVDSADPEVTSGAQLRLKDLIEEWGVLEENLNSIITKDFSEFDKEYKSLNIPTLLVPNKYD
jgi:photosystem II stability/assembly factor-like uncharacterized protein